MLISIGYSKVVVATSVVQRCRGFRTEATGASVGMKEPAFKDGCLNVVKLNHNHIIFLFFIKALFQVGNICTNSL